jgi:hypothetical protein
VFRLAQTLPDYLGVLVLVGGSPFDCAGLGWTDRVRMACKRPGVRVPLAPLQISEYISNSEPVTTAYRGGQFEGHPRSCR